MTAIDYSKVKCVVMDAFGTIAQLSHPQRPYSLLREIIEAHGAPVENFAVKAMTTPSTLAALASQYEVGIPMKQFADLETALFEDLNGMEIADGASVAIQSLIEKGIRVVIGSNLALPYGIGLLRMLSAQGLHIDQLASDKMLMRAFSYEIGEIKPHSAFYKKVEDTIGLESDSFLMVGDRPEEDREAPLGCGWQAEWAYNRVEASPGVWKELLSNLRA